jgi:hypothetical protein
MPMIVFTTGELFKAALDASRDLSTKILKLTDLDASPLTPGETADTRRHQIAKLGKMLAEAFITVDQIVQEHNAQHGRASDVTAGAPETEVDKPIDPNSN